MHQAGYRPGRQDRGSVRGGVGLELAGEAPHRSALAPREERPEMYDNGLLPWHPAIARHGPGPGPDWRLQMTGPGRPGNRRHCPPDRLMIRVPVETPWRDDDVGWPEYRGQRVGEVCRGGSDAAVLESEPDNRARLRAQLPQRGGGLPAALHPELLGRPAQRAGVAGRAVGHGHEQLLAA